MALRWLISRKTTGLEAGMFGPTHPGAGRWQPAEKADVLHPSSMSHPSPIPYL